MVWACCCECVDAIFFVRCSLYTVLCVCLTFANWHASVFRGERIVRICPVIWHIFNAGILRERNKYHKQSDREKDVRLMFMGGMNEQQQQQQLITVLTCTMIVYKCTRARVCLCVPLDEYDPHKGKIMKINHFEFFVRIP